MRRGEGSARLGLAPEFADSILGDWVALELLGEGERIRPGDAFGFITTDRATHDLRAPIEFTILARNAAATADPRLAQLAPTGEGWLLLIETASEPGGAGA